MTGTEAVHICDVIGSGGRYQALSAFTVVWLYAAFGAQTFYIQFLTPSVEVYWNWDTNRTNLITPECRLSDVQNFNASSLNYTEEPKLIYESQYSKNSLTEKFQLICERRWLVSLLKALPWICIFLGNILFPPVTAKYGRRNVSLWLIVLAVLSHICALLPVNYYMFAVAYFMSVNLNYASFLCVQQLTEIVPDSSRSMLGLLVHLGFTSGLCIIPGAAWISKDWFYTQLVMLVVVCVNVPLIWYMQESPAWLMVKRRVKAAKESLLKIAARNGRTEEDIEDELNLWMSKMKEKVESEGKQKRETICSLFQNRVIARYTCLLMIAESTAIFTTLGIFVNVEFFGAGLFEDFFISNAVTFLFLPLVLVSVKYLSAKWSQVSLFVLLGIVCGAYPFIYVFSAGRMVTTIFGRTISGVIASVNVAYTAEVFPTEVRVTGQGLVTAVSRLFVAFAPFTKELGERTTLYVPFVLFCSVSLLSAFLFVFLPNNKDKDLVHTVQQLTEKSQKEKRRTT